MKAKKRLKNIDFSDEGSHMALVGVANGGGANGMKTLVTKSLLNADEVTEEQKESLVNIVMKSQGVTKEEALEMTNAHLSNEGETMSQENVTQEELTKANEEAVTKAKEAVASEYEAIVKGLRDEIAEYEAEKQAVVKAKYVEKAKDYSAIGVTDENAEQFAEALMKMEQDESLAVVTEVLEKSLNIAKAVDGGAFGEQGHDLEVDTDEESGVMKALKARQANQSA